VDLSRISALGTWQPAFTLEKVLSDIRRELASRACARLPQPPEGAMF
jgi:ubiquitin-conjugating enzyme E2 variant